MQKQKKTIKPSLMAMTQKNYNFKATKKQTNYNYQVAKESSILINDN